MASIPRARRCPPIPEPNRHEESHLIQPKPQPNARTQFRACQEIYTPVEGLRKEYERYRFLHDQIAKRVTTELIIRTLLEHVGGLPKPTNAAEAQRHIGVMRLTSDARDTRARDAPPTKTTATQPTGAT